MGWMTFEKVLSRAAGRSTGRFGRPMVGGKGRYFPANLTVNLGVKVGLFSLSGHLKTRSTVLFLPFKNRYTSRNKCNGVQRGAINAISAMNFKKVLALFHVI